MAPLKLIANGKLNYILPETMKSAAEPRGSAPQDEELDGNSSMLYKLWLLLVSRSWCCRLRHLVISVLLDVIE